VTDPTTGRNEWRTTDTLEAARTERGAMKAKAGTGQSVARPTRTRFAEYAEEWLDAQAPRLRSSTFDLYRSHLDTHLLPRIGRLYLTDLDADRIARLVADLQREGKVVRKGGKVVGRSALSGYTVRTILALLRRILAGAVRRGLLVANAAATLTSTERPTLENRPHAVLDGDDLRALLASTSDTWRPLLSFTLATGLRQGEVLGLRWRDVDTTEGVVHVRLQLDREGQLAELKTPAAVREVVLDAATLQLLRERRLAQRHSGDDDLVFGTAAGTPLGHRNVLRAVTAAADASGLAAKCETQGARPVTFHELRHLHGSALIAAGASAADVSRRLGHSDITTTLRIYAHDFDKAARQDRTRAAVTAALAGVLS
jgi:integrase